MEPPPEDGLTTRAAGPWVRDKLGILEAYFPRFTKACQRKAPRWYYADGLAGSGVNRITEEGGVRVWGSALLALQATPSFTKCLFLERQRRNSDTLRTRADRIAPSRSVTEQGNVNNDLLPLLAAHVDRRAPLLCLLDPEGLEVEWETIKALSGFRTGRFKTELLILLNVDGVSRLLATYGIPGAQAAPVLDAFFPTRADWRSIATRRQNGAIATPEEAREEYFDLYTAGLRQLGYQTVRRRPIRREGRVGGLKYVLVFATDNEAGERIMNHCFEKVFPRETTPHLPGFEPQQDLA